MSNTTRAPSTRKSARHGPNPPARPDLLDRGTTVTGKERESTAFGENENDATKLLKKRLGRSPAGA